MQKRKGRSKRANLYIFPIPWMQSSLLVEQISKKNNKSTIRRTCFLEEKNLWLGFPTHTKKSCFFFPLRLTALTIIAAPLIFGTFYPFYNIMWLYALTGFYYCNAEIWHECISCAHSVRKLICDGNYFLLQIFPFNCACVMLIWLLFVGVLTFL